MDHLIGHENTTFGHVAAKEGLLKAMFVAFVFILACVVAIGFYRGWWNFASDSTDTKVHLNVTVDKDKLQEDKKEALEKVQGFGHLVKDKTAMPAEEGKSETAPPVQVPQNHN